MPNLPSAQEQFSQNGHSRSKQDLSEEFLKLTSSEPSTESKLSESPDDWSPLTQELIDTLPRVWTRGLLYFLVVFAGIVLPWAMLSKVDETGSARGRLEPKGATKRLDAPVPGTVKTVSVKEGQTVKAGQVLMQLESDLLGNELQQVETKLEGQLNRLAQLQLIENQLAIAIRAQEQQNKAQELEKQAQVEQASSNLSANKTTYTLQQEKLAQIEQARTNLSASQTAYILADKRFAKELAEVERLQKFAQTGAIPRIQIVEMERVADESRRLREQALADIKQAEARLQEQEGSYQKMIHQAKSEIEQSEARVKEQQSSYQSLIQSGKLAVLKSQEQLKDLQAQIATLQAEISQSKSQIKSLKFQLEQRIIRTPVEGTIFHLPVENPGVVVEPGQTIAQVAPQGAPLMLKAKMSSTESGFLQVGMPVKIKFDAYPFQDYGIIEGRVTWISPDSKITETPQGSIQTFELDIALDQSYIQARNKRISLSPGQTATAEVIVRQRRIIDFILDPFKKLQKGGLEL